MHQEKALAILQSGKNAFLTGSAGTGKTWLLRQYINFLRKNKIPAAVTASTGIAATHMNGQTIHSWSGMGVRDSIDLESLKKIYKYRHIRKNIDNIKVLIIDEISMLHLNQLTMLDQILRFFKGIESPFGGIQMILSGDFFQLPPITKDKTPSRERFAFMSESWLAMNPIICYLDKQYRQTDNSLVSILNAIRTNQIDQPLKHRLQEVMSKERRENCLQLYTHNIDVDSINQEKLTQLKGKEYSYKATAQGTEKTIETLKRSVLAPEQLHLRQHAKVIFVKNNPEAGYMNGTMGQVTGFSKKTGLPLVTTSDKKVISVEQEQWNLEDEEGEAIASYKQIPLRLAWAITIHKSQGMTLDQANINLDHAFEKGQGYVALSRLRSTEGLSLEGFNDTSLEVDPLALKADKRFQQLSSEADEQYSMDLLEQDKIKFIKQNKRVAE